MHPRGGLLVVLAVGLLLCNPGYFPAEAQQANKTVPSAEAFDFAMASIPEFRQLLSLPNDAHFPDDVLLNVTWCEEAFSRRGFRTTRLETDRLPLLLAERRSNASSDPEALRTVLIYLQLDGQPVDSSKWNQPSPWEPVLKKPGAAGDWEIIDWSELKANYSPDYRIFARASSDAKGPVAMFLAALDAAKEKDAEPNFHMKVIMDFEEELGSPRLAGAVVENRELLAADMLAIFDGPRHISNEPTLIYGARGIATMSLEVFGPRVPQHSGHYGNYAPNPALRLAELLASMKDGEGRVVLPGWYDGVHLSGEVREILRQVPDDEAEIKRKIGIAGTDGVAPNYQESIQYPSLNILGLQSGWVGNQMRTIIPASATAALDIRLVRESNPEALVAKVEDHIRAQGYHFVQGEPTEEERAKYEKLIRVESRVSYQAFRTDFDTEIGGWLRRAMNRAFGGDPIQIRTAGGSIPIAPFVSTLGLPAVIVPTVNPDNNQHSPNENVRLGNYVEGVMTMIAILEEKL